MYKVGNTELVKQVAPEKVFNLRLLELCVQQFQVKEIKGNHWCSNEGCSNEGPSLKDCQV